MKRRVLICLLLAALSGLGVAMLGVGELPPPEYKPGDYGSAIACYPTGVSPNYIVASDFNADGWLDLAVSCYASWTVWTYKNQGSASPPFPGVFKFPDTTDPGLPGIFGVRAGPVALVAGQVIDDTGNPNFNGFSDVGGLSRDSLPPALWALQPQPAAGPATLDPAPGVLPTLVAPVHMAAGDFDRADKLLDFAVIDVPPAPNPPRIVVYTSAGGYSPPVQTLALPPGAKPVFISVADFDQNGWDDIAVVAQNSNQLIIYYNKADDFDPKWPAPTNRAIPVGTFTPTAMDVGDFNADGFPDIVVVGNGEHNSGFARVFLNAVSVRDFNSKLPAMNTWGLGTRFVEVVDLDGNGRVDFVTANYSSNTLTVFLTWIKGQEDDDRNKRPECCLCDEQSKKDSVDFKKFKIVLECGYYPTSLVKGDFDRNGKMDLAVTLYSATKDIDPQSPSCIEIIFDPACGFQEGQKPHVANPEKEPQKCEPCKEKLQEGVEEKPEEGPCGEEKPCAENQPPSVEIQTGSETKNP